MEGEIKNWLEQAKRDFKTANNSFKSKDYYASAYFCQQVVEKGLKALYIKSFHKIWKIHDIVILAREVKAPEEIVNKCAVINPVYSEVRYPESDELPADKVDQQRASKILTLTEEILKWIEKAI